MWLAPYFSNSYWQDTVAFGLTLGLCLVWLRLVDALAQRGLLEQRLSRKIIHIGAGPLFVACWNLFSSAAYARYVVALVPLAITLQFGLVGLGVLPDAAAVKALTRTGNPREILRGPLYYGIIFVVCTCVFWLDSPVGIVALMLMCGGDGLADVVGRRWGRAKLPFNREKSWAGSAAMFLGGYGLALVFTLLLTAWGNFQLPLSLTALKLAGIALAATGVEAWPVRDIDNVTTTLTAVGLGLWWF